MDLFSYECISTDEKLQTDILLNQILLKENLVEAFLELGKLIAFKHKISFLQLENVETKELLFSWNAKYTVNLSSAYTKALLWRLNEHTEEAISIG